jgi:hypothetical protein
VVARVRECLRHGTKLVLGPARGFQRDQLRAPDQRLVHLRREQYVIVAFRRGATED